MTREEEDGGMKMCEKRNSRQRLEEEEREILLLYIFISLPLSF